MKTNDFLDQQKDNMTRTLQTLVQIPSEKEAPLPNMPFGEPCAQVLQKTLGIAESMGFETKNLENYIGYADYGTGEETFGILVHLDVVPKGGGWIHEPYGGTVEDGRIYGRGTADDKGPTVAALYALQAVKECQIPLSKKVRIIFGCDEESGWTDIDYYKKHEKMPDMAISPDGSYPIVNSEKGILSFDLIKEFDARVQPQVCVESIEAGTVSNVVPGVCTATVYGMPDIVLHEAIRQIDYKDVSIDTSASEDEHRTIITVTGKSAHASTPKEGVNALCVMLELLSMLPCDENESFAMIQKLHQMFPVTNYHGEALDIDYQDEKSGRLTCNLAILSLTPEICTLSIDIRHPASKNAQDIANQVAKAVDAKLSNVHAKEAHYVDEKSDLVQSLLKVYKECTGEDGYCVTIGGGTYARSMDNAVTFGCEFPGSPMLAHQPEESILLDELFLNAKILARAIVEICS